MISSVKRATGLNIFVMLPVNILSPKLLVAHGYNYKQISSPKKLQRLSSSKSLALKISIREPFCWYARGPVAFGPEHYGTDFTVPALVLACTQCKDVPSVRASCIIHVCVCPVPHAMPWTVSKYR
jgi:hypothetical protein